MKAPRPTIRGFTLIELLVAMSIFVVLGVLAYGATKLCQADRDPARFYETPGAGAEYGAFDDTGF